MKRQSFAISSREGREHYQRNTDSNWKQIYYSGCPVDVEKAVVRLHEINSDYSRLDRISLVFVLGDAK